MNQSGSHTILSGNPCKITQDRITLVERHFGEICQSVGGYVRTLAKLRNKGDQVARSVQTYAQNETHNPTTQAALKEFVGNLSIVEDYRNTEVKRLEVKVIDPLTTYGKSCKRAKERIRTAFAAHDREVNKRRTLDQLMERSPNNALQIYLQYRKSSISTSLPDTSSLAGRQLPRERFLQMAARFTAQNDLQRAALDASRASHDLEQEMDAFERKKLEDVKQVMSEFVSIQLAFHSKALEFYSQCHQSLSTVRQDDDLEEFRNSIRPLTTQLRQELQQQLNLPAGSAEKKTSSLPSSHFIVSTTGGKQVAKPDPANRNGTLNSTNPSSMYSQSTAQDDDDDDDDDDSEEEDDDDDDDDDDDTEQPSQHIVQKQTTVQGKPQITPRRR